MSRLWCALLLHWCCMIQAENLIQNNEFRTNYTANDLIRQLTVLATESVPRLRFPNNEYNSADQDPNYRFPPIYKQSSDVSPNRPANVNYNQDYINYQNQAVNPTNLNVPFDRYPVGQLNQQEYYRPPNRQRPKKRPNRYPQYPFQQDPYLQGAYPQVYPAPYPQDYPQGFPQDPYQDGFYPPGAPFPPYPAYPPYPYPEQGPLSGLTHALNSIAKYDDQKCVPRLLCEVAAGGNPGAKQSSSFLPSFLNMESLFTLLSAFAGNEVSPFLVFGRAALLGVSSQGSPSSCRYAYPECPRDPDRLVEYLNNHNGGFFRFFNGLGGPVNDPQQLPDQQNQQNQQFGIGQLNQLFGQNAGQYIGQGGVQNPGQNLIQSIGQYLIQNGQNQQNQYPSQAQRPQRYPYQYFGQRPNQYNNQDDYKRYPYRYEAKGSNNITFGRESETNEARIQNQFDTPTLESNSNDRIQNGPSNDLYISQSYHHFNYAGTQNNINQDPSWKFPEGSRVQENPNSIPSEQFSNLKFPSDGSNYYSQNNKRPKGLFFPDNRDVRQNEDLYYPTPLPFYDHSKMIFPDRTGTGNLKFDLTQLQNSQRPIVFGNEAQYISNNNYNNNYYNPGYINNNKYSNNNLNYNRDTRYSTQYQAASTKKLVYVVRGNGDPNHPEIVEAKSAREIDKNDDDLALGERRGRSWTFPSAYQGVTYNDRSFDTKL